MLSFLATSSYFLSASAAKYFASYIQETQNKLIILIWLLMTMNCNYNTCTVKGPVSRDTLGIFYSNEWIKIKKDFASSEKISVG